MARVTRLTLYSTLGCHLCEQALALSKPVLDEQGVALNEIDIAESDALMERYGVRIPVLRESVTGLELGWPFDAGSLRHWLESLRECSD